MLKKSTLVEGFWPIFTEVTRVIFMQIPDKVSVDVSGSSLKVKGPCGEIVKSIHSDVSVKVNGKEVEVSGESKMLVNTFSAHVANMLKGASEGYSISLKSVFAHFPFTVEIKGKEFLVKNFLGEKTPRKGKIVGATKIEIKGQDVKLSGPDKEAVTQTFANMRLRLKIRNKDSRTFQDGLYKVQ